MFYNKSIVRMIEHEARSDGSGNMASALTISAVTPGGSLRSPDKTDAEFAHNRVHDYLALSPTL